MSIKDKNKLKEYHSNYIRKHYQENKNYYRQKNIKRKASMSYEKRLWESIRTRARSCGIPFDIEVSDIVIPEFCPVLGKKLIIGDPQYKPSVDRLYPELGYVKGNINVISLRANKMKNDGTPEEVYQLNRWIQSLVSS